MIQIGDAKIPEIELGAKNNKHPLPKCENICLFGKPEEMSAYKTGCIQKCVAILRSSGKMNTKSLKGTMQLINDHFQNNKSYGIPKAQLIIADIPYNIGKNAYGSSPEWYIGGDNRNGESKMAGKEFFDMDKDFRISEFLHFCSKMPVKEPAESGKAPCMIVFCEFEQQFELIKKSPEYGLNNYINLVFRKNFSA
jgi:hypothetical protein